MAREHDLPPFTPPQRSGNVPSSRPEPPALEELGPANTAPDSAPPSDPTLHPQVAEQSYPDWMAPLHNRLIIAGLSVLVLLALTAGVLYVFSLGDGGAGGSRVEAVADPDETTTPAFGLSAEALATTTLYNGPADDYAPLGTIPLGSRVTVIGRSEDPGWIQVNYPPGSSLEGWVEVRYFDITGDISILDIAGPGEVPDVEAPVPTAVPFVPVDPQIPVDVPTDTPLIVEEPTDNPDPADEPTNTPRRTSTPRPNPTSTPPPDATEPPPPPTAPAGPASSAP